MNARLEWKSQKEDYLNIATLMRKKKNLIQLQIYLGICLDLEYKRKVLRGVLCTIFTMMRTRTFLKTLSM